MANAQTYTIELELSPGGFSKGSKVVQRDAKGIGRETRDAAKGASVLNSGMRLLAKTVATVGLTVLASQAGALATQFGDNLTRVNTLVGVSRDQVQAWRDDLLEIGPAVGRLPNELAPALFTVTSAGERGAEALDVLEEAGKAAAVGLGATAVVAKASTAALQAYKEQGLTASQATDVLVATVREGNLEASELAGSLGRVIPIASQLGVSFGEVGGFVATFTRLGASASESVTALKGVLTSLIRPTQGAKDALASVGLSVDDVRKSIQERGLAQTLVDLLAAFEGNEEGLAQLIPNVEALAGVLGTAGAQAEEFLRIEQAVVNSTGTLAEAFEGVADSPGHVFRQVAASVEVLKIAFGEGLAKSVANSASGLRDLSGLDPDLQRLGSVVGDGLGIIVLGLKLLAENAGLVKAALLALLGLQLARWLSASAAATKLLALANVELGTALWAVRSGYAKLIALDLLAKLAAWTGATKLLAVSTAGLAAPFLAVAAGVLALNAQVTATSADLDRAMAKIITRSEGVRSKIDQASSAIERMSEAQLKARRSSLQSELSHVSEKLASYRARISEAEKAVEEAGKSGGISFSNIAKAVQKAQGRVEDLAEAQAELRGEAALLRAELGSASEQLAKVTEENAWAKALDDLVASLPDMSAEIETAADKAARLKKILDELEISKSLVSEFDGFVARMDALNFDQLNSSLEEAGRQAKDYVSRLEIVEELISRGIPPTDRMIEKWGGLVTKVILAKRNFEAMVRLAGELDEAIGSALQESISQLANLNLSGLRQGLETELAGIEIEFLPDGASLDRMGKEVATQAQEAAEKAREAAIKAYQEVASFGARVMTGMLTDLGAGGQDIFRNLWGSFLDLGYQAIEQVLQRWLATKFADKAVNIQGQGGGLDGTTNAAASAGLGTLSTFAAVAAIYTAVFDYAESVADKIAAERFGSQVRVQYGQGIFIGGATTGGTSDDRKPLTRAGEQAAESLRELLAAIGGFVAEIPRYAVEVQNNGEQFRATVESSILGIFDTIGTFGSYQEALEASMLEAVRRADFSGVGDNVAALLANSTTESLERFGSDLQLAKFLDFSGLSETKVFLREFQGQILSITSRVRELGLSLQDAEQALLRELDARRQSIEATLDGVLGYDSSVDSILAAAEAAQDFNAGALEVEDSLRRAREQAQNLADNMASGGPIGVVEDFVDRLEDTTDGLRNTGDGIDDFFDGVSTTFAKVGEEADDLADSVRQISLDKIEAALQAVSERLQVNVLRDLADITGSQEAIARAAAIERRLQLAQLQVQIAQLQAMGQISRAELQFLQQLVAQAQQLPINIPQVSTGISVGDSGVTQRREQRERLLAELQALEARLDGTFSSVADQLAAGTQGLEEELLALGGFVSNPDFIARLINARQGAALEELLAPMREIIAASGETDLETQRRHLEDYYAEVLRGMEIAEASAEAIAIATEARDIEIAAIERQIEAAREARLTELAAGVESLRDATNLSVDQILARRDDLISAYQEMGASSIELVDDIQAAAQAAIQGTVGQALGALGLPAQAAASAVANVGQAISTLTAALDAGAISAQAFSVQLSLVQATASLAFGDRLMGFVDRYYGTVQGYEDIRIQLEQTRFNLELAQMRLQFEMLRDMGALTDATIAQIQGVLDFIDNNPPDLQLQLPQIIVPQLPASATSAVGETLADVLAEMQSLIADWGGSSLNQWEQQILRLQEQADAMIERILAAGGTMEDAAPLLDALAIAIQGVKDSALDALRELREQLFFQAPNLLPAQQLDRLLAQFQQLSDAALGGDSTAQNQVGQVIQQLYSVLDSYGTGSTQYQEIEAMIQAFFAQILGPGPSASFLPPPSPPGGSIDPFVGAGGGGSGFEPSEGDRLPSQSEGRLLGVIETLSAEVAMLGGEVRALSANNEEFGAHVQRSLYERRS